MTRLEKIKELRYKIMKSLSGILVVSIEQAVAAPLCTARLVDAGARVIKIERKDGDFSRNYDSSVNGESSYFTWLNQGKESVVLNFRDKQDRKLLLSLLKKADIFIQNLKPGTLNKYKLDSESISKENPEIITCDISGYGEGELEMRYKSYDLLVQAESGLIDISGTSNAPGRIGISICDIGAGLTSYAALLEGLIRKYRGFGGSRFKTSLFSVLSEWMTVPLAQYEYGGKEVKAEGLRHPSIAPYGAFYTEDQQLILIAIQNEREWSVFCKKILKSHVLVCNKNYSTNDLRVENRVNLENIIQKKFSKIDSLSLKKNLTENSIAFGVVNDIRDFSNHFALHRQWVTTSAGQKVSFPKIPVRRIFQNSEEMNKDVRAPKLGEHSQLVRNEFNGL